MAHNIRMIVVNASAEDDARLRAALLNVEGVKIVAEVADISEVEEAIECHPAEVILVDLDLPIENLLPQVADLASRYPERSIFGISRSEDARKILAAMRAGLREYFTRPLDGRQLIEALTRRTQSKAPAAPAGKVIAVVGGAGGVGTTMLSVNLAGELAAVSRHGTALVDLDLSGGHAATLLDLASPFNLADLCGRAEPIDSELVTKALTRSGENLHVLAGVPTFDPVHPVTLHQCAAVVDALADRFQYVVCDGPRRADPGGRAILAMADTILIVLHPMVPAIRNAEQFLGHLERAGLNLDRVRLVLNRYQRESSSFHPADLEQVFNRKIAWVLPDETSAVVKSVNMGRPLAVTAGKSRIREAIRRMAGQIHEPPPPRAKPAGGLRSLARILGMI